MFNVGGGEVIVILLLALLLLGPDRLPEAARKVGKVLAEVRRVTSGFEEEVRSAMDIGASNDSQSDSQSDDALERTSSGPRLVAPVDEPEAPRPSMAPSPFVADLGPGDSDGPDALGTSRSA